MGSEAGAGPRAQDQKPIGAWRMTFRRLRRSHTAIFGMSIAVLVFLVAALADVIAPYGYAEMHPEDMLQAPSGKYLLGTDQMGRDVLSRVIYGSRISHLCRGGLHHLWRRWWGCCWGSWRPIMGASSTMLIMRLIDIWVAFPNFLLALVISVILGPSVTNVVIALAIVRVPTQARVVRGTALSVKENDYVQAARAVGAQDRAPAPAAHPAQLHGPGHRVGHPRGGHGDHCGGGIELFRPGHAAANPELGLGFAGQCGVHRG